jgi:hypothetical protein
MTARRRARRRPLAEFAARSPLHAIGVWLLRSALIGVMFLGLYLLIVNVLAPGLVEGMLEQMDTR